MKKIGAVGLSFLSCLTLGSCASTFFPSSSFSSSSYSSHVKEEYPYHYLEAKGDASFGFDYGGDKQRHIELCFQGCSFSATVNEIPLTSADLFDPDFQARLKMAGALSFSQFDISVDNDIAKVTSSIKSASLPFYIKDCNLYVDFTGLGEPDLGGLINPIPEQKLYFSDFFSLFNKLDPGYSIPLSDLPELLMGALEIEELESYLSIAPYDKDTLDIGFVLNGSSLTALINLFGEIGDNVKSILENIPESLSSHLRFLYNITDRELSAVEFDLKTKLEMGKYIEGFPTSDLSANVRLDLSGRDGLAIPELDEYSKVTIPDIFGPVEESEGD